MTLVQGPVAVTGATGLVGRAVLKELAGQGLSICALTRSPRAPQAGIDWITGTLSDVPALSDLVAGADSVLHIAGLTKAPDRATLMATNADATARLAAIARAAGVRHFILISSLAAREPHLSDYAASKAAGEAAALSEPSNMALTIIRPPALVGPDDPATAPLLSSLRAGWLPAPGGRTARSARFSLMHVDDIARYIAKRIALAAPDTPLEPMAEPGGITWQDLAATASRVLSKPVRVIRVPPVFLFPAAYIVQAGCATIGKSTFFNTGKVREMLHTDWTGSVVMNGARELGETLRLALGVEDVE